MTLRWHRVQSSHGPVNWLCENLSDNCLPCWYLIDTSYHDETVTWQRLGAKGWTNLSFPLPCFKCGHFLAWFSPDEGLLNSDCSGIERGAYGYGTKSQKPIEILAEVASFPTRRHYSRPRPCTAVWLWAGLGVVPTWHCLAPWLGSGCMLFSCWFWHVSRQWPGHHFGLVCQALARYAARWLHDILVLQHSVRTVVLLNSLLVGRRTKLLGQHYLGKGR